MAPVSPALRLAFIAGASLVLGLGPSIGAGHAASDGRRAGASVPFISHQDIPAEVSKADREAGVLSLRSGGGRLRITAPPTAMAELRKGDRVLVGVTVVRHADPSRLPRRDRDPQPGRPLFVQQVDAEVTGITRTIGVVSLKTSAGPLKIDLPQPAIADLKTGDRLPIQLSVRPDNDVAASARTDSRATKSGWATVLFGMFGRRP